MRVTENGLATQVLATISEGLSRLMATQERLATSKRINRPSDDPVGAGLVVRHQATKAALEAFQRATDATQEFLGNTGGAIERVTAGLQQAREVGLKGSNDLLAPNRGAMAEQVDQLLEDLLVQGNARFAERYIFGGTQTVTAPFTATRDGAGKITAVTANPLGITGAVNAEVADGVTVRSNLPGTQVFTQTVNLFDTLIALRDALAASNTAAIVAATAALDGGLDQATTASGVVGVSIQRLETVRQQNLKDAQRVERLRSQIQDADIAALYVELQRQQNAFEASLQAGARALQPSLVDFIR